MNILLNIIWLIFGGLLLALEYFLAGVIMCCTIIGIPFGIQSFKMGILAMMPFGSASEFAKGQPGCLSVLMNIIWILVGGIWIALTHLILGVLFCITIIGIPFGLQHFKLMVLSFSPFGRDVVSS